MNKPENLAKQIEIIKIGDGAGIVLPPELLERLQLDIGDLLSMNQTNEGISLSAGDTEFAEAMKMAEGIMDEDRDILSVLAK
jgi:putative addiction module antidote